MKIALAMSQLCVMLHNGSKIDKISMGELFHVIYFHQIEQPQKYFDHKNETTVYKLLQKLIKFP